MVTYTLAVTLNGQLAQAPANLELRTAHRQMADCHESFVLEINRFARLHNVGFVCDWGRVCAQSQKAAARLTGGYFPYGEPWVATTCHCPFRFTQTLVK